MTDTPIDNGRLLAAVWKALDEPTPEPKDGVDYYCTVVADAVDLPAEEVQTRLGQRDRGIMVARNLVKNLLFMRHCGVSPTKAIEWSKRSTQTPTSGTQTSSSTATGPSKT